MMERSGRWAALQPDQREAIKNTVLQTLSSAVPPARNIAALVVSKLAYLEMAPGKQQWETLLPNLVGMLGTEAAPVGVRASCAQTIGYVMEALDEYPESPLLTGTVEAVLVALLAAVGNPAPEMQLEGMRALQHSIVFFKNIFEDEETAGYKSHRDRLVQSCLTLAGTPGPDHPLRHDVREKSMEVLVLMAEYYYANLGPYIGALAPFTAQLAAGGDEVRVWARKVCARALRLAGKGGGGPPSCWWR